MALADEQIKGGPQPTRPLGFPKLRNIMRVPGAFMSPSTDAEGPQKNLDSTGPRPGTQAGEPSRFVLGGTTKPQDSRRYKKFLLPGRWLRAFFPRAGGCFKGSSKVVGKHASTPLPAPANNAVRGLHFA